MPLDRRSFRAALQKRRLESSQNKPTDNDRKSNDCAALALSSLEVALPVAWLAGPLAARSLRAVSSEICRVTRDVFTHVLQWCPGCIYVCGGTNGQEVYSAVDRFNPVTNSWDAVADMPRALEGAAAASVEGKLYICGGSDGYSALDDVSCFDNLSQSWSACLPMMRARHRPVAVSVGGVLCVMGGREDEEHLSSMECLDLSSANHTTWAPPESRQSWAELAHMGARRHGAVAAAIGGKIYVCGGFDGELDLKCAERYDVSNNSWTQLPNMRERRHGPLAAATESKWYVCGGFNGPRLGKAEVFDTRTSIWNTFPPMPVWRRGAVASAVAGKMYVCGGQGLFWGGHLGSVDVFDPSSATWIAFTAANESTETSGSVPAQRYAPVSEAGLTSGGSAVLVVQRRNAAASLVAV